MYILLVRLLFVLFISLTFFSSPTASVTATHTYDELNRLIHTVYESGEKAATIDYSYDPAGNIKNSTITANFLLGDVDDNQRFDLADVILCLQVLSGIVPISNIHTSTDIDGNDKIGTAELIFILWKTGWLV